MHANQKASSEHLYVPEALEELPNEPGIYLIYYCPISLDKLGLRVRDKPATLGAIYKKRLLRKLEKLMNANRLLRFNGILKEKHKAPHVSTTLEMSGTSLSQTAEDWTDSASTRNLSTSTVQLFSKLAIHARPLYVGMTTTQTIRERLQQHANDYDVNAEATFGSRLHQSDIPWEDLIIKCLPASETGIELSELRGLEKLIQQLLAPILSYR